MPLVLIFHPLCAIPLLMALVGSFAAVSISPPSPLHGLPSSRRRRTKTKERRRERAMRPTPSSSSASLAPAAPQQGLPSAAAAAWMLDGAAASQHRLDLRRRVPAPAARPARRRPPLLPRHGLRRHPLPRRWERTADASLAASRLQRAPRALSRGGRSGRSMAAAPASVVGLCSPAPSSHDEVRGRGGGRAAAPLLLGGRAPRRRGPRADRAARPPRRRLLPPGG